MEISEKELRRMLVEVDDLQNEGLTTMQSDIAELHAETRRFRANPLNLLKQAGIGGAALTIGNTILPFSKLMPAYGQSLTDGDIAAFAESVELAAVAAYTAAAKSGKVKTKAVLDAATLFATHHQAHANNFGAAAGAKATKKANAKLVAALTAPSGDLTKALAGDEKTILEFAMGLENAAAATYLFALGALTSEAALKLTASILPVESQHAVIIGMVLGKSGKDLFPKGGANNGFETADAFIDPAKYPVG